MINKKKRKLRAPVVSLSDTQFLLNTPCSKAQQTPNKLSSSILNRQNLTYTPMTQRLLKKQRQFTKKSFKPILPSISSMNINNKNENTKRKNKKRKYAEIEEDASDDKTPIIPCSVRKKRRLSSNLKPIKHCTKHNMTNSDKKKVMKKVLNNEYNPSLSLSSNASIDLLIDYEASIESNASNDNKMVLDFDTPSKSITPKQKEIKKKKRRLSSVRIEIDEKEEKKEEKKKKKDMISRRRRKRNSLSSNAIKKVKKKIKININQPINVKKTYKRRERRKSLKSTPNKWNKYTSKRIVNTKNNAVITSICPLITKLIEDRHHSSQIAAVSYECFNGIYNGNVNVDKQSNILRKMDRFLCLLCRAEIMLNNDERGRLKQIDDDNKIAKKKGKRVRFCSYDLSTVSTPQFGELDSLKHLESICRLLVESGKIGLKLFSIKSEQSWTRKTIKMFICSLLVINNNKCTSYLLNEFNSAFNRNILYPFCGRVSDLLSSSIRFYLKTIFNASEFLDKNNKITIPSWYNEIGTFSINEDNNELEFIPYHAAELSINLKSYYYLKDETESIQIQEKMDNFGINDNPFVFFNEMKQVLCNVNHCIYGETTNNTKNKFEKYLFQKWKQLKLCLKNVEFTKSQSLYFYLPLLDFAQFLNKIKVNK